MRTRTQEILHNQMMSADSREVMRSAILILDSVQGQAVKNQLLGIGIAALALFELYGFKPQDILGTAHNILYEDNNGKAQSMAAGFKRYLRDEWNLN